MSIELPFAVIFRLRTERSCAFLRVYLLSANSELRIQNCDHLLVVLAKHVSVSRRIGDLLNIGADGGHGGG